MSWEPLADTDPLPGDPAVLSGAAGTLNLTALDLATHASTVQAVDAGPAFVGLAAQRFVELRDESATKVSAAAARCSGAGAALTVWSAALAHAQEVGAAALRLAQQADDDRATALAGIEAREQFEADAQARADAQAALDPHAPPPAPDQWTGPDWSVALADAEADLETARTMLALAELGRDEDAAVAVASLEGVADDTLDDTLFSRLLATFGIGDIDDGIPRDATSIGFVLTPEGLVLNTPESWRHESYAEAGIDPTTWDPSLGLEPNDATAQAAWDYYRTLYLSDPDHFQWAGLAWFAGATVYAGVQDLSVAAQALRTAEDADEVRAVLSTLYPQHAVTLLLADYTATEIADELDRVEATMMDMQRQIFDDMAWKHVAFRDGGLEALTAIAATGAMTPSHLRPWQDLASGNAALVPDANRRLAYIEQHDIIGDEFDELREDRGPISWGVTMATSVVAESPVPGGEPFREVVPYEVGASVDLPDEVPVVPDGAVPDRIPFTDIEVPGGGGVSIDTPDEVTVEAELPLHNVSIFGNRWTWITDDMLPAYGEFLADDGWSAYEGMPLSDLARDRRVISDDVLAYNP